MMNQTENERSTALEVVTFGRQRGIDMESIRLESMFRTDQRWIFLWRKRNGLPCSGRAEDKEGTLHYNMQGAIGVLPNAFRESAGAFGGSWSEAGTLDGMEEAFELVKAWLLDRKDVDDLPQRHVRRSGIG